MGADALILDGADAFPRPSAPEMGAIVYLALVVTCAAFIFWYEGINRLGVDRAGLFAGLIPVATLLTAISIGNGSFGLFQVIDTVLVGVGVTFGVAGKTSSEHATEEGVPSSAVAGECIPIETG